MKKAWLCSLCLLLLPTACTSINSNALEANKNSQVNMPKKVTALSTKGASKNELYNQIEQISRAAQGRVGVAATVLETGESVTLNGDQRFPMQSVYKFPIGMAVLNQVDKGNLKLEQKVRISKSDFVSERQHSPIRDNNPQGVELSLAEVLKSMVSESDGTACDVLLRLVGGPEVVTKYLRGLGVNGIIVATTENEMGQDAKAQYRNWASPEQTVALLRAFQEGRGLSQPSRALLLQLMTQTPTGLKRIKGLLPAGTVVAHKTGTSRPVNGVTSATNDVGIVTMPNGRHLAVAVFVSDAKASDTAREAVIAKVARATWDKWSK